MVGVTLSMPKYDVKCESCEFVEEIEHKMSEDHPPCSECGSKVYTYFPHGTVLNAPKLVGGGWTRKIRKEKPVTYTTKEDM